MITAKVFMSPNNGAICVGIPLFTEIEKADFLGLKGYRVSLTDSRPLAYAVDIGLPNFTFMNAEFFEKQMIPLGDL